MSNINKKINIFKNVDFHSFFPQSAQIIKEAIETYWECEIQLILFAINDFKNIRDEFIVKNIDFFSSQIKVEYHKPVTIRLDKDFIDVFLDTTLKSNNAKFYLREITPLEITILNNFCEFLYRQLDAILVPAKEVKITPKSEKHINLVYSILTDKGTNSKVVVTLPQDRIKMQEVNYIQAFQDEDFIDSASYMRVRVGYTKLTLEELQHLSKDDIILLEDSTLDEFTLVSGDVEQKFHIKTPDSLKYRIDDNEEEIIDEDDIEEAQDDANENNEVKMRKNLWDDIQIELSAEFSKVKMTIRDLKQITKGQIVDLGSIFDNEISLYIEDKKVATGELIIINDKYALRLDNVLSSNVDIPSQETTIQP
ncbi:FliM/FliN family flagellar motor switch protein, partial [bacterium]|nr:FliM/FliN family flagellar motor switch protein [bacterium]